jgi:hypothetical protein
VAEHADGVDAVLVAVAGGKLEDGEIHFVFATESPRHREEKIKTLCLCASVAEIYSISNR